MANFNDFVQTELPKRPFVEDDGAPGQILKRSENHGRPRELVWADFPSGYQVPVIIDAVDPAESTTVQDGQLWWSFITGLMKVRHNGLWFNVGAQTSSNRNVHIFNSIADGETSIPLSYEVGSIDVFLNGLLLVSGFDYTATNGTSIEFAESLRESWLVIVIEYRG